MSDLLEVLLLFKESGLLRGTLLDAAGSDTAAGSSACGASADLIVSPLFETIGDLQAAAASCASSTRCRASRP